MSPSNEAKDMSLVLRIKNPNLAPIPPPTAAPTTPTLRQTSATIAERLKKAILGSPTADTKRTLLDVVKQCDNFPHPSHDPFNFDNYAASSKLWRFYVPNDNRAHGYILPRIVKAMPWTDDFEVDWQARTITLSANCKETFSVAIRMLLFKARKLEVLPNLEPERADGEVFPILGSKVLISIERAAASLFGIVTRGVHMVIYVKSKKNGMGFWIARRNLRKLSFPGMWDNPVAGGVATGETPFSTLIREAHEETGFPEDWVRKNAKPAGVLTHLYISDEKAGGELSTMNPGISYVYDLEIAPGVTLQPVDGDVHEFVLMSVERVERELREASFKPHCANVIVDFLIRHGVVNQENEGDLVEIAARLHRPLPFPISQKY